MAEVLGPNTIASLAIPTGVDGAKVAQFRMQDGTTFQAFAGDLSLALGSFNSELVARFGGLMSLTEELMVEYENGGTVTEAVELTDTAKPEMVHGTTIGHMIDLKVYGVQIGGSKRYFRDTRPAKIQADLRTAVRRLRERFEKKVFSRFFLNTEYAIGTAGYNVPFVRGTGGNVDFAPPQFGGQTFTTSHDHFIGVNSASLGFDVLLNNLAATVEEHGHEAPYTAFVSRSDVASYRALAKFVQFVAPIITTIDRGATTSGNELYATGQPMVTDGVFGYFQSDYGLIELRAIARIPTGYAGLYKSYGDRDARNPLAIRVHPETGFGAYIVPETSQDQQYPIQGLTVEMEYDVGVGTDRTNGAAGYRVSGGAWANPTIS